MNEDKLTMLEAAVGDRFISWAENFLNDEHCGIRFRAADLMKEYTDTIGCIRWSVSPAGFIKSLKTYAKATGMKLAVEKAEDDTFLTITRN